MHVQFLGESSPAIEMLYLADVVVDGIPEDGIHIWGSREAQSVMAFWMGLPRTFSLGVKNAAPPDGEVSSLQTVVNGITGRYDIVIQEVMWQGEWRPNIRMAERFREGRVFLAGGQYLVHFLYSVVLFCFWQKRFDTDPNTTRRCRPRARTLRRPGAQLFRPRRV